MALVGPKPTALTRLGWSVGWIDRRGVIVQPVGESCGLGHLPGNGRARSGPARIEADWNQRLWSFVVQGHRHRQWRLARSPGGGVALISWKGARPQRLLVCVPPANAVYLHIHPLWQAWLAGEQMPTAN